MNNHKSEFEPESNHRVIVAGFDGVKSIAITSEESPIWVRSWEEGVINIQREKSTSYGFVFSDFALLKCANNSFRVPGRWAFSVPGPLSIEGGSGLIVTVSDFLGIFTLTGPVEDSGRLKYIDGCTDTLLIAPLLKGNPCLNFLSIPKNLDQRPHTHPSVRVGLVLDGRGICRTPDEDFEMRKGNIFILPKNSIHSFHTRSDELKIAVFHPDSDFGPTSNDHPMLNRTIVNGISAAEIRLDGLI